MSGGSLWAGTCRLTNGRPPGGTSRGVSRVIRRRHRSVPSASQSSHRYAQASTAANSSSSHSTTPPVVPKPPRPLVRVHCRVKARYETNRNRLPAQHRCARAFQRRVAGSHSRLIATRPAVAAITLVRVACSAVRTTATTAASSTVPSRARTSRRVAGHVPATRRRGRTGTNSAAEVTGAATRPASSSAASMPPPVERPGPAGIGTDGGADWGYRLSPALPAPGKHLSPGRVSRPAMPTP